VLSCLEQNTDHREACTRPYRADNQELLASYFVDDGHGDQGEHQVGRADGDRLQITRDLGKPSLLKNVVQVIQDWIDT